jgi:HD domain-containing protein/Big-like domain-containing protein
LIPDDNKRRWAARPVQAGLIRAFVFLVPIAGSVVFLHFAGRLVPVPTSSFLLFVTWWVVMSGSATLVLLAIDRVARRLLPLAALYKLSLVFPDAAPSRFRTALRSNTAETLEQRVARAKALNDRSTPTESAERLLALVAELNTHDRLTRGHSDRVRAYSQLIGEEMRLDSDELELLNWSALLHDVGKLNVPSEILTKDGRPTDEEWEVLRRHPEFGMALVAPLRKWLGEWSAAVAEHHERWDGKGYPKGISGDRIPLAARIVAVADVFDVITSARSYKSASASTAARDEIARCAGTQFDPRVVRAFLNVSLGRLRLVMGPLSWLAHAPLLGRLPLTPAIGGAAAALATVTAAVTTGVVGPAPTPAFATNLPTAPSEQPAVARAIKRFMPEDEIILVGVESAAGGASVASLDVSASPRVGRVQVTKSRKLKYSPPPNFNGDVSIGYSACWRGRACRTGVVAITVEPVNDEPVARDDATSTSRGAPVAIDVLANDSDPDGDQLSIRSVSDLGGRGRARRAGGRIVWTPARAFLGAATFAYTAADGHRGASRATVTIRVRGARTAPPEGTVAGEPPSGAGTPPADGPRDPAAPPPSPPRDGSPPQALEDRASVPEGGTVTVDVLANDSDPDGDRISIMSVGSPDRGTAKQIGDRIEFSAPADHIGEISFPYVIADTGGATDRSRVSVSVRLVNDAPTFTAGADQRVLEDSGAQRVARWARDIGPGASSEGGQTVSFLVANDNPALFRAQPEVHPDGSLTYAPATNANGDATVSVRARDDGGTANGGRSMSASQDFTITVKAVNDPPSFTPGADQAVPEDAGAQTVAGWARNISAGPRDESRQDVAFVVTNGRRALFTSGGQPRIAPDGTLMYTQAANANGSATVTVRAKDDGGTSDGGEDTSPARTFTITVAPVNDPPSFTAGADQVVPEDSGVQTIAAWATDISPGPTDESAQGVTFLVSNDNAGLFGTQPAVAPNGTLTYAPAANANGVATVAVRAQDDGGGTDASAPQTFTITVTPVNDAPVANPDNLTVAEDDPAGVTFNVLANDTDVDTGDALALSSHDDSAIANGTLTYNGAGAFTYVPDPGFAGTETFTYVVADTSGATATETVTITVTAVPNVPVAGGDAYLARQDTPLIVAPPGVLENDGDQDGDTLTVQTSPISGPANGGLVLSSDGSFTYTPGSGFTGTDTFTYRVDDGTGRSADGVVTITVTSSAPISSTLYFQPSGPSADVWNMLTAPAPAAPQLADFDSDGKPGLTIKNSDGSETETDGRKFQTWAYSASSPLLLNGPVTLDLWSSTGLFVIPKPATLYAYLYDCTAGGASCTRIASNAVFHDPWNTSSLDWTNRTITIGSVSRTIPAGNELHVKLLFHPSDLWMTMSAAYPTALVVTLG